LAPGDLIELHYHSSSWSVGKLNQEYWDSHFFKWDVPCLHSSYSLLAPPEKDFQWKLHNHDEPETIMESKQHGDFTLHSWRMEDIPARSREVHAPPSRDVSPWLDVSTIDSWGRIVEWYADLSEEPSGSDPQINRKVMDLLGESETGTMEAGEAGARDRRIATLYDFVANLVAYENLSFQYSAFIPEPAKDVLRSMYGDCKDKTCLLRSMLDAIGVESSFALVTPVTMGMREHLPSPRFSHVILAIPSEDGAGYWFLDPTAKGAPATDLPEALQGANTLVIRKDEIDLASIPFSTSAGPSPSVVTEAQIESGSDMAVKREETIRTADGVATIRSKYASADDEKRSKLLTADLGRQNVGIELLGCSWSGLEPGVDSVRISYELRLREAVSKSGDLRLTKLPWRSRIDERFSMVIASATREEPLLLYGLRLLEDESLRLALPEGWSVEGVPESRTIESAFGSYTVSYSSGGGSVDAHRTLQIAGSHVPPESYLEFKRFLEEVIREQDLVLVLRSRE
jgi:hypothetical protein